MEKCKFCGKTFNDSGDLTALVQVNMHMLFGGCEGTKAASHQLLKEFGLGGASNVEQA